MFDNRDTLCEGCPMPKAVLSMEAASQLVRTSAQKTFRVNSYPILLPQTEQDYVSHVVNHYMDVSGERELYMRLVQSEKLAAVGGLAGNIAHELNNPLSGIRAMAQVLRGELGASDPHGADLGEIENAAVRCQDIIRNLLGFSQAEGQAKQEFDLNALIERTLPLLKTALRQHSVQVLLMPDLKHAYGQPGQIQQVIFNLINNASQAMTLPGTLTLRTWEEGAMIGFSVSDTGPGIPPEIRERIFEPFFTTKSAGVGTGLGLSVSRNIVEKAGGVMRLESFAESGSTFSVLLPKQGRDL
jgi:signal transduction histidine kinase